MKSFSFFILTFLFVTIGSSQPSLIYSGNYGKVSLIDYDSLANKIYVNYLHGCPTWNIPCAYSFSLFSQYNIVNKHSFSDNTLATVEASRMQVNSPSYPVNNFSSGVVKNSCIKNGAIFTNFGYYFNCRDTALSNLNSIWSYSPASNPSYKEISTFEIKSDSIVFFEKDSTSGTNYYTVFLKNVLTGANIPYNSIQATFPLNSKGAINGLIRKSVRINNRVLLVGAFTASVSGNFIARNIVSFNMNTGSLEAVPLSFQAGSEIYDLEFYRNKLWLCGKFQFINGLVRKNFAVLDADFTLSPETILFGGSGSLSGVFVDAIEWYHDFLAVKGNFNSINGTQVSGTDEYSVKVFNVKDSTITPWTFNLPGTPLISDYIFEMFRNKLYIRNKTNSISPIHIYCFEPITLYSGMLVNSVPVSTLTLCSPGFLSCTAPFKNADNLYWNYSGSGVSIQTQGTGEVCSVTASAGATSGTLSVIAYNDCGLSSDTVKLFIKIASKPDAIPVSLNPKIFCNPDSVLLTGSTNNSNGAITWRKSDQAGYQKQPYYTKLQGNYFMVVTDTVWGCADSTLVSVTENKIAPNAKLISHIYSGITVPIDTVTCAKPLVNIVGGSDTSGTTVKWRALLNDSIYSNPLSATSFGYYKLITTRINNGCADSSLFVLVGEDKIIPSVNIPLPEGGLNCSNYSVTLEAFFFPLYCGAEWLDSSNSVNANPFTVTSAGNYRIKIINPVNGCIRYDSIYISSSGAFEFVSSSDTMICKNSELTLHANVTGTVTNVNYYWNDVLGSSSMTFQPAFTTTYVVSAISGTCAGTDTIIAIIPSEITDSVATFKNCSDPSSGSIALFASGGRAPYEYSIDGGSTFHTSGVFANTSFGVYNIVIRDSMLCSTQGIAELNAFSNLPEPKWLSSSYNSRNDTLILVDVSIPKPDSVQWLFPAQVLQTGGDMFNPVITMSDTGTVNVIMKAFYTECIITTNKWIRFGESDSLMANLFNDHGIQSFIVYPNPSDGLFTVEIQFSKKQNAVLQVWDNAANKFYQDNFYNVIHITSQIDLRNLLNGNYFLRVISEYDSGIKTFVISK